MRPSTAQAVLTRANEALQQGEWETALASFQSLLSECEVYEGLSWAAWRLNDGSMSRGGISAISPIRGRYRHGTHGDVAGHGPW